MAFTGTYKNGTLTVRATAGGTPTNVYFGTAAASGDAVINVTNKTYTGDAIPTADKVTVLDASGVAAKNAINFTTVQNTLSNLETLNGGKGADTINATSGLTVKGNAGADTFIANGGTVTDYDGKNDIVKFTNDTAPAISDITATYSGKNLTLTYGDQSINLTNGRDKMINIADKDGNIISSQYFPTDPTYYEITNSNTGTIVSSEAAIIDGSARKAAVVINGNLASQSIVGGTGNDTIYANKADQNITGGKGNDVFVIGTASGDITIKDFTVGNGSNAGDIIALDGITILENQTTYDTENNSVTFAYAKAGSSDTLGTIEVDGGLWNQLKPAAAKAQIQFATYTNGALSTSAFTGTYSDPTDVVVSGSIPKTLAAGINLSTVTASGGDTVGTGIITTNATTVDFSNVGTALNISIDKNAEVAEADATKINTSNITEVIGGKGKDTLKGIGSDPGETTEVTVSTATSVSETHYTVSYTFEGDDTATTYTVVTADTTNVITSIKKGNKDADSFKIGGVTFSIGSTFGPSSIEGANIKTDTQETSSYYKVTLKYGETTCDVYMKVGDSYADLDLDAKWQLKGTFTNSESANYGLTRGIIAATAIESLDINGGAGNDLLTGSNAYFVGGAGNDTFRAASGGGATFEDEAGNDVFLLTGEGADTDPTNYIDGYYAGTDKTTKAAKGTDKIVVAYDKINAKNVINSAHRAEIYSSAVDGSNLVLKIGGESWGSVTNDAYTSKAQFGFGLGTAGGISTFTISDIAGQTVNLTEKGITYNQIAISTGTAATVTGNWLGYLDPNATKVSAENTAKGQLIDLNGNNKAVVVTGSAKNDTIKGNGQADTITGGKGADLFFVQGGETITDYAGADGKEKDKLYIDAGLEAISNVTSNSNNGSLVIDVAVANNETGYIEKNEESGTTDPTAPTEDPQGVTTKTVTLTSAAGKTITFNALSTNVTYNAKTGLPTEKAVTNTMVRTFGTAANDSIVSFKAADGNYLKVFSGENFVTEINASKGKAMTIDNDALQVNKITASGKADIIYTGSNADEAITVKSGAGNDIIILEGNAVITDFTAAKINNKGKITAGDVIVTDDEATTTWDGNDVIITGVTGTTTLVGAKDKDAIIMNKTTYNAGFDITATVAAGYSDSVNLANPAEYLLAKTDEYDASKVTSGKTIINAAASTKAPKVIDLTATSNAQLASVTTVYTGAKADTVVASSNVTLIDTGAGNDVVSLQAATGLTEDGSMVEVVSGAGNDIFVVDGDTKAAITDYTAGTDKVIFTPSEGGYNINITGVSVVRDGEDTVAAGKGKNAGVAHYYTYTYTLDGGGQLVIGGQAIADSLADSGAERAVEKLKTTAGINAKLTVIADTVASAKATSFALDYMSANAVIENADGSFFDLTGANATTVQLSSARTKAATITGAKDGITVDTTLAAKGKGVAVTFIGNAPADDTAVVEEPSGTGYMEKNADEATATTYIGGAKNDIYIGGGNADVVQLGAGNDTIGKKREGTNKATITLGSGNDVAVVNIGDAYTVTDYDAADSFVIDSTLTLTDAAVEDKVLTLSFKTAGSTEETANATVKLTNYTAGTKVTVKQFGTNNKGKEVVNPYYVSGFGTDISYADADGTTISAELVTAATKITPADSKVKKAHVLVTTNTITEVEGGAGNDTIYAKVVEDGQTLSGGRGNDTFVIGTAAGTYTIKDFNTGNDILSVNGLSLSDLGDNYTFNGKDAIITTPAGEGKITITLKDVVADATAAKSKTTSAIRYTSSDSKTSKTGVTLSDRENVVLQASPAKKEFTNDTVIKSVNAAKSNDAVTIKFTDAAGEGSSYQFGTYVGSKKGDTLDLTNAGAVAATLGAGDDNVTLGDGKLTVAYGAGKDKFTNVTASNLTISGATASSVSGGAPSKFTAVEGKTVGVEHEAYDDANSGYVSEATATANDVTFIINKKAANTIELVGTNVATFTQTITRTVNKAGSAAVAEVKDPDGKVTTAKDAVKSTYDWTRKISVTTSNGLTINDYFTETKKNEAANPFSGTIETSYEERGFEELVSDDNFATASDLDNITDVKADDAAIAVDYSNPLTSIDSASDFTQVTTAAAKKKAQA